MRAARVALFVVVGSMLGAGAAPAQSDLAKALVGTWQGELQQRMKKGADPVLTLIISSVKQEGGSGSPTRGLAGRTARRRQR